MFHLDLKQIYILKFKNPSRSGTSIFCATLVANGYAKELSHLENKNLQKALEEQGVLPI